MPKGLTGLQKLPLDMLAMCRQGLHASGLLRDALDYAPGPRVSRVVCSGRVFEGADRLNCWVGNDGADAYRED